MQVADKTHMVPYDGYRRAEVSIPVDGTAVILSDQKGSSTALTGEIVLSNVFICRISCSGYGLNITPFLSYLGVALLLILGSARVVTQSHV